MVLERPSPLTVEREELAVDCALNEAVIHADCTFTATYFLHNPTASVEEVLGAFYTVELAHSARGRASESSLVPVEASLDGRPASAEATPEQLERMDQIVLSDPEAARAVGGEIALVRVPFRVVVEPGAHVRLLFHGPLNPTKFEDDRPLHGYTIPAIIARHVLLAPKEDESWTHTAEDYLYLISPLSTWAGDPEVVVSVRYHERNDFTPSSPSGAWTTSTEGGITTSRTVVRASARKNLRFRLAYKAFPIINGGPLVGIGPRIAREELRVRAGYEISGPEFLIYGIAAESNFDTYFTGVATIEAATPNLIFIFPSLALGLGVPVQVRHAEPTRVGGRLEFTASFPVLSFVFPVDFYPVANSSGSHWEGAFLTQLSF
jgi:hypothetical protein